MAEADRAPRYAHLPGRRRSRLRSPPSSPRTRAATSVCSRCPRRTAPEPGISRWAFTPGTPRRSPARSTRPARLTRYFAQCGGAGLDQPRTDQLVVDLRRRRRRSHEERRRLAGRIHQRQSRSPSDFKRHRGLEDPARARRSTFTPRTIRTCASGSGWPATFPSRAGSSRPTAAHLSAWNAAVRLGMGRRRYQGDVHGHGVLPAGGHPGPRRPAGRTLLRFGFGAEVPVLPFVHVIGEIVLQRHRRRRHHRSRTGRVVTGARFWFGSGSPWGIRSPSIPT